MASTILKRLLNTATKANQRWRSTAARVYFSNIVEHIETPFEIDWGVDIRTPAKVSLQKGTVIKKGTILNGRSSTHQFGLSLGPDTYIKEFCYLDSYGGFIEISGQVAIGQHCLMHGGGGLRIGKYVMFGPYCCVVASNHVHGSLDLPYILQGDVRRGVTIEDNVWLGAGTLVLDGVTIGRNSVIGAGAIVTKDIPPNSIFVDRNPKVLRGALHRHFHGS